MISGRWTGEASLIVLAIFGLWWAWQQFQNLPDERHLFRATKDRDQRIAIVLGWSLSAFIGLAGVAAAIGAAVRISGRIWSILR
ncbi:MAG: hypothetical protein KF777_23610 [Planctomycetaceae bacterium]|nr:hypothetical protein [Planctomycetaceae bacterium]